VNKEWTMTERNDLRQLKTIAKHFTRMQRLAHHEALDLIARELGHPHWRARRDSNS
jgi:hypothetical protein